MKHLLNANEDMELTEIYTRSSFSKGPIMLTGGLHLTSKGFQRIVTELNVTLENS